MGGLTSLRAGGSRRFVAPALAVAPALYLSAPFLTKTPLSSDHAVHLFNAWHFWTEMLGRGRLRGWSHFLGFGYPSGELIPYGSDVWVALFRAATLGQLSWMRTYALAFGGFLIFKALTTYWFARGYFRVGTAVVAAWIMTWDPGAMLQGGWVWHTYWGVWPVSLSMSLALLSLVWMRRVLISGRVKDVFWAGVWLAAALLTHPLAIVIFGVTIPIVVFVHVVSTPGSAERAVSRVLGATLFGFALGGSYLVPLLSRGSETRDLGWLGESLSEVGRRFIELRTFDNVWAPVHGFAIIGAWFALRSRRRARLFFVASAGVFVLLSSDVLVSQLHLERAFPGLVKMEFNRNLLVAKAFWFPLAAHALVQLARVARLPGWGSVRRVAVWVAVPLALGAGVVLPGWSAFYATQIEKPIQGEEETALWQDLQAFLDWSEHLPERGAEHYRIAYHMYRGNHLSTLAPVFNRTLYYKVGTATHQLFNKVPTTDENELFQALSVKYVMSSYELASSHMAFERRFGDIFAYRFLDYRPDPFTVLGPGHAELVEFGPERIRIRLRETTASTRLKIHVANYPRWRATFDGEEVPISTVAVYGSEYPVLMEVPARDGELLLQYVYRPADWWGLLASSSALAIFALVAWASRRRDRFDAVLSFVEQSVRANHWVIPVVVAGIAAMVAVRTLSLGALLPAQSIFHRTEGSDLTFGGESCRKEQDLSFACGSATVRADAVAGMWGVHDCMTAPDGGELRIRARMALGSFLAGNYNPTPDREGTIRLRVDGREIDTVATRPAYLWQQLIQFDTRQFRNREATVELTLGGAALHCFDFRVVP